MIQRLVANWLRQQAEEVIAHQLQRPSEESPPRDVQVMLVFPSAGEAGGLVDRLENLTTTRCDRHTERIGDLGEQCVAVIEADAASSELAPMARDLIRLHSPDWVIASGFCAARHGSVGLGQIVMADQISDVSGYSLCPGFRMNADHGVRGLHVGGLLTATESDDFRVVNESTSLAVDRQAAIIAEVCRLSRVRMLAVHVVANAFGDSGTVVVEELKKQSSLVAKLGAAAGALIEQPGSFKHVLKDKEQTLRLSDRLANFLVGTVEQLSA